MRHETAHQHQEASIARTPKASPPAPAEDPPRPRRVPKATTAAKPGPAADKPAKVAKPRAAAKPDAAAPAAKPALKRVAAPATKPKAKPAVPEAKSKPKAKPETAAKPAAVAKRATKAPARATTSTRVTAVPRTRGAKPTPAVTEAKRPAPPRPTRKTRPPKVAPDRLEQLVAAAAKSLEDDKAEDIRILDVTGRADYADRLIIATGLVDRQIQAMATHLVEALEQVGLRLKRDAIQASPDWVLIDALDLVIHLFKPEARALYGLERMWGPDSPAPDGATPALP
ncbi:ribosome silencing factor [Plastoroseomonas arctica]|uniref:ribosome silencing factor n=1 Tax=Plastoroseomonas arctica TaxID=1509237 RepID=UPI0038CFFD9E